MQVNSTLGQTETFRSLVDFVNTLAELCQAADVIKAKYESGGKTLVLNDQFCFNMLDLILLDHF